MQKLWSTSTACKDVLRINLVQKEYKKVTKSSLSLSDPSEVDVLVEYISRIRCSVKVHKCYAIGGIPIEPEKEIDPEFEKMNKLGGLK